VPIAVLERVTATLLRAEARGEPLHAAALTFLLRRYAQTGREEMRPALEEGLAVGLDALRAEAAPLSRCEWLDMLLHATPMTDDHRIDEALRTAMPSLVEDLERFVRMRYEPGEGLVGSDAAVQVGCGSALLSVFAATGRLPYAMLAEELLQVVRRRWWDEAHGAFSADVIVNCRAARLCCQIATLHGDPDYRDVAVVALGVDYRRDASRALASIAAEAADEAASAAQYGLAVLDWLALANELQ
jgi:hypothetical protein